MQPIATVAFAILLSVVVLATTPAGTSAACDGCQPATTILASESAESAEGDREAEGINPGIFVLALVLVSIVVATIMVMRQSRPGLPEGYGEDEVDDGTSGDQDTSSR